MPTPTRAKSVRKTTRKSVTPTRKKVVAKPASASRKRSSAARTKHATPKTARRPLHKTVIHHIKRLGAKGFINKKFLIFLVGFMVIGGGYLAYRSFADTTLVQADGEFTSLAPARILDTRTTTGGINHAVGQTPVAVQVTGQGGVPASGVKAVVMNVTVTGSTANAFLTVWPSGIARPNTSNLNFAAGQTIANQVTVPVGVDGKVLISANLGTTHVIFDVAGYYSDQTGSRGARLNSINPVRVLDTRTTTGGLNAPIGQTPVTLQVTGKNGIPAQGVTSVVATVTVTDANANSFLTLWPNGGAKPNASNINFMAGQTIANTVTLQLSPDGKLSIANNTGLTNVILDIAGYYTVPSEGFAATQQGRFVPVNPARIFDTRNGTGGYRTPLGPGSVTGVVDNVQINGMGGVPGDNVDAVVLNVTVADGTAPSFLTVYPSKSARPTTSNINFGAGQAIPNQVVAKVGSDGKIVVYNNSGNVNVIIDVAGYYVKENDYVFSSSTGYVFKSLKNTAKLAEADLSLSSLPVNAQFFGYTNPSVSNGVSTVSGLGLQWQYDVSSSASKNYLMYSCFSGKQCEVLVPGATSVSAPDGTKTYSIPYSLAGGKMYHLTYQLMTNTAGHTGVWEKASISESGVVTPIAMEYLGPATTPFNFDSIQSTSGTTVNSCNAPKAYTLTLTNIKFDGTPVKFSQDGQWLLPGTSSTPMCPGFENISFSPAADGSLIMKHNVGVSSINRDTTPPKITSMTASGLNITTTATDDKAIATYSIDVDNMGITISDQVTTLGSTSLANSITKTSNVYAPLSPGPHTVTVKITDTSGNVATKSLVINI